MTTVKVRIPVVVSATGFWVCPETYHPCENPFREDDLARFAADCAFSYRDCTGPVHVVWVEAEVPLPEPLKTVQGEVAKEKS